MNNVIIIYGIVGFFILQAIVAICFAEYVRRTTDQMTLLSYMIGLVVLAALGAPLSLLSALIEKVPWQRNIARRRTLARPAPKEKP